MPETDVCLPSELPPRPSYMLKSHSVFFDNLVELIPAKFYLPPDDDKPRFQGLSRAAKAEAKLKSIENVKKGRRDRLDPEKSSKTTLDLLKESLENEKAQNKTLLDDDDDDIASDGDEDVERGDERSVTYEELRLKLRKKIEELRGGRGGGGSERRREKQEQWKRKRADEAKVEEKKVGRIENEREKLEKEVDEKANDFEFGKVKLAASNDDGLLNKKKKRKLSKEEELKRARELEEAMKDPEKGEMVRKKHAWKAATERAMGIKVHDKPSLLQKSLKKEMKQTEKSKEKWKQRVETTEKMKKDKQDKRKGNIKAKIDRKKQAKIAKREKKLMRPGFEGRKEGFVTGS